VSFPNADSSPCSCVHLLHAPADYFRVPSVAHYLIVHPIRRMVTHHRRTRDGIETRIIVNGPIAMDQPEIIITTEEIYGAV
jgi:hypothetical protein